MVGAPKNRAPMPSFSIHIQMFKIETAYLFHRFRKPHTNFAFPPLMHCMASVENPESDNYLAFCCLHKADQEIEGK